MARISQIVLSLLLLSFCNVTSAHANSFVAQLFASAENGKVRPAIRALRRNIDVNSMRNGQSALHIAAHNGNWEILLLLARDPRTNIFALDDLGQTVLHHALMSGDIVTLNTVLELGINPNIQNIFSQTAIELALSNGFDGFAEYIEMFNAELDDEATNSDIQDELPSCVKPNFYGPLLSLGYNAK